MTSNLINNDLNAKIDENEEINLLYLLNIFLRNKILIGGLAFIFFLLSYLFSLTRKKIWEGKFEIVLNNPSSQNIQSSILNNQRLQKLVGLDNPSMDSMNLSTEIGILESPVVLMPIFEFLQQKMKKAILYFQAGRTKIFL